MRSLNDGHYAWTSCYDSLFNTFHFLPLAALQTAPNGQANIHLVPDLSVFVQASGQSDIYRSIGIDPDYLAGAQVVRINGREVFDYLTKDAAADYGVYQDVSQRLNALMTSYTTVQGSFAHNGGGFTTTNYLDKDNITLTVKPKDGSGERDVVVPWLTYWTGQDRLGYFTGSDL